MKQALTLTSTADPLGLDSFFSGAPLMIYGDVPDYPDMNTWMMQLWKRPHDAFEDDAAPLATAVGSEIAGVMTITFTAAQTGALALSNEIGANSFYLTIGGVDANDQARIVRGGTIEIVPGPFVTDAGSTLTGITITDDVASFVFNGVTYSLPVAEVATPPGAVEGELVVIDDMLVITIDGISYTTPVASA